MPKPPPIYVHEVINYNEMIRCITEIAKEEQFYTTTMANNIIKLSCITPNTYREIVKHFKDKNMFPYLSIKGGTRIQSSTQTPPLYH
jgi:dihydroneopterin aldolase